MAPYARWAVPSFRTILLNHCDDYMKSSDRGPDKSRSKLVTQVAQGIADIAKEKHEALPNDLEKVMALHMVQFINNDGCF